jgi:hypothetical protein
VPHLPGAGEAAAEAYNPQENRGLVGKLDRVARRGQSLSDGTLRRRSARGQLVCEHEELFCRAVFLSAWLSSEKSVKNLSNLRGYPRRDQERIPPAYAAKYWGLTPEQAEKLVTYSQKIKKNTYVRVLRKPHPLKKPAGLPARKDSDACLCAKGETAEMKASLDALGKQNTNCLTVVFPQGSHDFVLRNYSLLNPMLMDFLTATEPRVYC